MKNLRFVVVSLVLGSASALSWAQTPGEHNAHHPAATATPGASSATAQANPADNAMLTRKMDTHIKAMHEFHEKLQKASPAERQALMADHQSLMQDGMKMMGMASAGMQGMDMGMGMPMMKNQMHSQPSKDQLGANMQAHHTMMLKRMDMMEAMMKMMMDVLKVMINLLM